MIMSEPINWCHLKENVKHLCEVVTSRQDGKPNGAAIQTSTDGVTGKERDTLDTKLNKFDTQLSKQDSDFNANINRQDQIFQDRFSVLEPVEWTAETEVTNPLQVYKHTVAGAERTYLADPTLVPFTTGATFADDEALNRWVADDVLTRMKQWRDVGDVRGWGVSTAKTSAQNKAILQDIILMFKGERKELYIPSEIDYGYVERQPATFPSFVDVEEDLGTDLIIHDYAIASTGTSGKTGAQERVWACTGGQYTGLHNGNGEILSGNWHPYMWVDVKGDLDKMALGGGKNLRASYFTGAYGVSAWRFGQGNLTGEYTEAELQAFVIAANGLSDLDDATGLTTCMAIRKDNGCVGFNVSQPRYPFDFVARDGQPSSNVLSFTAADSKLPTLMLQGGGESLRLVSKPQGFGVQTKEGTVFDIAQAGASSTISRKSAGNITFSLRSTDARRDIVVRNSDNSFNITNSAGTSNVMTLSNTGNMSISGAYSPFTGTHIFFCKSELREGDAVDLLNIDEVDYTHYKEVTHTTLESNPKYSRACKKASILKDMESDTMPNQEPEFIEVNTVELIPEAAKLRGEIVLNSTPKSKVCVGIVERQEPIGTGYLTYVAAVGDSETSHLKGFRLSDKNGECEAGDILCTSGTNGELMKADECMPESVVRFKLLGITSEGRGYGYFK